MFSFFLHISEGKLVLICFDLLTELCSCHRHRLPLCPFNHQPISRDKVFPRKTEIPLFGDCAEPWMYASATVRQVSRGDEFSSTSTTFLVLLPRSSNQETRWHCWVVFNKTDEHPAFWGGGEACIWHNRSHVLKWKFSAVFFRLNYIYHSLHSWGGWYFDAKSQKLSTEQDCSSSTRWS